MAIDVLIMNTAAVDLRHKDFDFVDALVGKGGLARCESRDMPDFSEQQFAQWLEQGFGTAGGPGNTAPLLAKCGLKVAVGANLGKGNYDGLDALGRFYYNVLASNGVDVSEIHIHPELSSGISFIHDTPGEDRGGLCYFPNANNDFNFEMYKESVKRLKPEIAYYMYSGLSTGGDANGGSDLADFMAWCRDNGIITIVDSHTLTGDPKQVIDSGSAVAEYKLLEPLFSEVDLFFTSSDEAIMIANTLGGSRDWGRFEEKENNTYFLNFLSDRFWQRHGKTRMFGITVSNGAFEQHCGPDGSVSAPAKIESMFMDGEVIDLVGAGDSFRAGLISYICHNIDAFKKGNMNFAEAVQMANLFAARYIKAPLDDRYCNIEPFEKMRTLIRPNC